MPRFYIIANSLDRYPELKTFLGATTTKEEIKALIKFNLSVPRPIYDVKIGESGNPNQVNVTLSLLGIISLLGRLDLLHELLSEGKTRVGFPLEKELENALLIAIRSSRGLVGQELLELAPHGFIVNLSSINLGPEEIEFVADILKTGKCPEGLTLKLMGNKIDNKGAKALADALQSGKCPESLKLDLMGNKIDNKGAKALADALQSGKCPESLKLDLMDNQIDNKGAKALADALQSGKCPAGLTLGLSGNHIRDEGAIALAEALQSGKCPAGLTLNLSGMAFAMKGAKAIARALVSQTSVIVLWVAGDIALLSKRNRLLAKYPQYEEIINFAFAPICQKILSEGPGMMEKKSSVSGVPKLRFFAAQTLLEEVKQPQSEVGKNLKEQLENLRKIQRVEREGKPIEEEMRKLLDKSLPRDLLEELMFLQDEIPQEFQQAMPKKEGPL